MLVDFTTAVATAVLVTATATAVATAVTTAVLVTVAATFVLVTTITLGLCGRKAREYYFEKGENRPTGF